jgi:hypothetical protein
MVADCAVLCRKRTSVGQKLPAKLDDELYTFLRRVIELRKQHSYPPGRIWNADEKPVHIDSVPTRTIDVKGSWVIRIASSLLPLYPVSSLLTLISGSTAVKIRSTGHEKDRITAMLCVSAAGQWCQTMIFNKLKTPLKRADQHGFRVRYQESVSSLT